MLDALPYIYYNFSIIRKDQFMSYKDLQQLDIPSPSVAATVADLPEVRFLIDRELEEADLPALTAPQSVFLEQPTLRKLLESHHRVAMYVAAGKRNTEISRLTGYCPSTITTFKNDPAFISLVKSYNKQIEATFLKTPQKLDNLTADVITEIHQRLTNQEEKISITNLTKLAVMALDRTGHGPTSKTESLHVTLNSNEIADIKAEAKSAEQGSVVDATVIKSERATPKKTQKSNSLTVSESGTDGAICSSKGKDESCTQEGLSLRKEIGEALAAKIPSISNESMD